MNSRTVFFILTLASLVITAAALIAPETEAFIQEVPISIGDENAPIHIIRYGSMKLPETIERDIDDRIVKLTIVSKDRAHIGCESIDSDSCGSTTSMPIRYNPSLAEPAFLIGYRLDAAEFIIREDRVEERYRNFILRLGR